MRCAMSGSPALAIGTTRKRQPTSFSVKLPQGMQGKGTLPTKFAMFHTFLREITNR